MEKERFSLLLLEPNEIYFEDFIADMCCKEHQEDVNGRLKIASKSLIFEPLNHKIPIYKFLLIHSPTIEERNGQIFLTSKQQAKLLEGNRIAPYVFHHEERSYFFKLSYVTIDDCLPQILQLQRASSLPPAEQEAMIATISYSRQCRLKFNSNYLGDFNEKIELEMEASKVTPLVLNPGRLVLTTARLYFKPVNNADTYPVLKVGLREITEVKLRRFLQRYVGMEIFFTEAAPISHLYLSFKSEIERAKFYNALSTSPAVDLPPAHPNVMTLKWQNHAISNYEYLMYLNSLADRSVNDLTQYPVFPWVIADYTSEHLDLDNPETFRDLTKPIGALNPERLQRLKERRREMQPPTYLYGSHYSAPAFVLFFLFRKVPQLMLCLQNGRFDHPDRIFHSLADVWRNAMRNMSDFKELVPEFYNPSNEGDFLTNMLGLELGVRHDGRRVHNVVLPPWCQGPQDLVQRMRDALESPYVSEHLHAWIDLIFGYSQQGEAAELHDNVFHPICYEGSVNLESIYDISERHALEVQIMEFGQIPKQIFNVPHPKRRKFAPSALIPLSLGIDKLSEHINKLVCKHRDTVTGLICAGDAAFSVGRDSALKELNCSSGETVRSCLIETVGISSAVFLEDRKTIALGTFDNRIIIYDLEFSNIKDEVRAHEDTVIALCWNAVSRLMLSGSWDGSLRVWPSIGTKNKLGRLISTATIRYDHDARVTCAALNVSGSMAACGIEDGDVYVYSTSSTQPEPLFHLTNHCGQTSALVFTCDDCRLITSGAGGILVYDVLSGLLVFEATGFVVRCLDWLSEKLLLLGCEDGSLRLWNLHQVKEEITLKSDDKSPILAVACSMNGRLIVKAQGNKVTLLTW